MLVQMKTQIGGYRNGEAWPAPGGLVDLPAHEAADMIANGYAEEAPDANPAVADDPVAPVDDVPADADDDVAADPVDEAPAADTAEAVKPKRTRKA